MSVNKKILFVDDEGDIREVVQIRLESNGYDVVTASNGEEALEKISREKPDLVILDVMMPEMDGLQVLKRIRKDDSIKHLPVILLTAKRKKMIGELFEIEGIQGFVEKPFDSAVLLALVRKALNQS